MKARNLNLNEFLQEVGNARPLVGAEDLVGELDRNLRLGEWALVDLHDLGCYVEEELYQQSEMVRELYEAGMDSDEGSGELSFTLDHIIDRGYNLLSFYKSDLCQEYLDYYLKKGRSITAALDGIHNAIESAGHQITELMKSRLFAELNNIKFNLSLGQGSNEFTGLEDLMHLNYDPWWG